VPAALYDAKVFGLFAFIVDYHAFAERALLQREGFVFLPIMDSFLSEPLAIRANAA
jgi:hypothetical protein